MESKTVLYFGFHAVDSGIQVLQSGFQSGLICIPDSLSCIPESKAQGFRFHSKISWIPESVPSENFPESGILIPLHGANTSPGLPAEWSMQGDSTSGEPDGKQVAVTSKENSQFRFRFQNKRTPFHIMLRL